MRRVTFWSILGVLVLVGLPPGLLADAPQTGLVTGVVHGPDGAPLPGVTVQLTGEQGAMTAVTGADGRFKFVFIQPGPYLVRADLAGFQGAAGDIDVSAGGRAEVELKLGEVMGQEVVVTGEAPLVNKFDMTGGGTVGAKELDAITGEGRQYRSRLMFLPDVYNDSGSDAAGGNRPTIAGQYGPRNMYFIDGVDVSFARWGGGSQFELPAAAVSEMKLESSGADAEFSRSVGAFTRTIVKSGSNDFHGSASWKGENLAWNANNKNVEDERPDSLSSSYDATLGGPIVRDRLWFFATYRQEKHPDYTVMADGVSVVDVGSQAETRLAKLDWRPNASQSVSASYSDIPLEFPWWAKNTYGDIETVAWFESGGDLATASWNWAISDSLLLTARGATTQANENRSPYVRSNIEPGCGPEDPCGDNWIYVPYTANAAYPQNPQLANLAFNGLGLPLGEGYTAFPRDQLNASLEWFLGSHDFKAGIDYQKVSWDTAGVSVPYCRGRGYDEHAPGGFLSNASATTTQRGWCAFYPTKATWEQGWGPVSHGAKNTALFIKDRFTTDKWTFNLGLRADHQVHKNDVGTTVIDDTSVVPRLAASFDVFGDSTFIVSGSVGRYVAQVELAWSANFNVMPQGRIQYEVYRWNRDTQGYDDLFQTVGAQAGLDVVQVDPYYKDEVTVGAEWQFRPDWALKATASYWQNKNYPNIYRQIDPVDGLYNVVGNVPGAKSERKALTVAVQRRYKNGWLFGANYTYSQALDNCGYAENGGCTSNYGELAVWTMEDGTLVSQYNEWGPSFTDATHIAKVRGAYQLKLGKGHSLNIGGLAYYVSGRPWTPGETWTIPDELNPLAQNITRFVNLEPAGNRRITGRTQLDLNVEWRFPISGQFSGFLRTDILNATNEQSLIAIGGLPATGTPILTTDNFQYPRIFRALVGFQF